MAQEKKLIGALVTTEFERQLRIVAAFRNQTKSQLIREALTDKLSELGESLPNQRVSSVEVRPAGVEE